MVKRIAGRDSYPLMTPPPDIANSFLHIANCNYPPRLKRMFFENVLREILLRLIAHKLPGDEMSSNIDELDAEKIKSVPGILMDRLDSPPSIFEIARELSMNATKLKQGFKKIFGKPIYAYHHSVCLDRATIMLLNTNKSVFEIAIDAGYSNGGNFCNAFKKRYGLSPSQYRRKGKPSSYSNTKSTRLL
jgi:AraC-like DNA-binding protein